MARKVLVVDDNMINRLMLINALNGDYDIIEASDGKEALSLMHRNYKILSAVLLDIFMPEMDGYDVLRHMRENAMLAQIPVIMVTGSDDEAARVKALSLGANDFVLKPINPEIVRHCLRNNIVMRETASILNAIQKDKLTGLYNREAFFEKAGAVIRDREPGTYVLFCFDIDNFKLINDQYGSVEGDRILRDIGKAVKKNIEAVGGMAGRISADNFAALLPASQNDAELLRGVADNSLIASEHRSIVFSLGRYLITDISLPASAIYDRAYLAKQSVKGRYDKHIADFDETMLQKLVRDQQIVGDMENALAENQFEVWFQPQYNHVTGALTGAEALVRWRDPEKGIIAPGEFIPLFEQNGFVYELDKFVWRESCRYLRRWMDEGFAPLPVSVNISRYDIFRADFLERITGIVKEFDIPAGMVRLEITESAFSKSTKLIVDIVKQLVKLGFFIEIDDFGSGYSSLNTLKSVPAQMVKLDMRFLENNDDAKRGGNIIEAIVRMTKWLGMSVIAEGVETKEQGDFLKSIGCSHVQGCLYASPMPASEYRELFTGATKEAPQTISRVKSERDGIFWNPQSMDSLVFNSYVGSACIFEYYNGRIELLRATDKYARMFGGENMTVDELMRIDMMKYLDRKTAAATFEKVEEAVQMKGETTGEFLFNGMPGCSAETWIRSTMRVISSIDNRSLIYCLSENITAQRLSERKERRITRQLQVILDNVNCGITAFARDGELMLANDKFFELLGYTRSQYAEEVPRGIFAAATPQDSAHCLETAADVYKTGRPSSIEYRALRRDGRTVWLRSFLSAATVEGVKGKVQLCTYADITAEKHTAQNLLDNLPCGAGICVYDGKDARMIYLNKRYFTYFSGSRTEAWSGSVFSRIHPDDRAGLREAMLPIIENGDNGSFVARVSDGADKYIQLRISGVAMDAEGFEKIICVSFVPVSHEELSFGEMLSVALEKMMASSSTLCFVKDKNLKYICCSRAFAVMVGLESEKDISGKTDYDIFGKELADSYVADDRRLLKEGGSIVDMVEELPSQDGRGRYSNTSKYLLYDSHGNAVGIYGVGQDITQSREAELQQKFLINNIPGGVAIYEGQWSTLESIRLTYFSDGFCRLFGYSRSEYEALGSKNATGLVAKENLPGLISQIETLVKDGTPIDYIYRARVKNGSYRWIHLKALPGERHGENMTVNAVLFDITEHQEALERLRVSEEESRLAMQHSDNVVCRYEIEGGRLKLPENVAGLFGLNSMIDNIPEAPVKKGDISPETSDDYISFYNGIRRGEKSGSVVYQRRSPRGWRWIKGNYSTIFSGNGVPISAVISFLDVTDAFEKDAAYRKWIQTLHNRPTDSYALLRCNISKKKALDETEGKLFDETIIPAGGEIEEGIRSYARANVLEEDVVQLCRFVSCDLLLEKYYRGERTLKIDYREKRDGGEPRWLRLTIDLVAYASLTDVEAYLLFEDIDEKKRAQLLTAERAETDPLTGVYNRTTFTEKMNASIAAGGANARHALLMLDIDGFKLVNDVFGHAAGDQTLIDIATMLRTILRRDDLVCRLGGDEFLVFLNNIPDERIAENKARRICELCRKSFSNEVKISGSVGIALCPENGTAFDSLYKCADETLYHIKGAGRNNFAFYRENMKDEHPVLPFEMQCHTGTLGEKKRRMLIVDDSRMDFELMSNIFKNDFIIEQAKDGVSALVRMRHYGTAISVVLLDLIMPGMGGFSVLEKMRQSHEAQSIPVVVVSAADDRETALRAIRSGADDFVMKPVDADLLRIRVNSAVSRAENERLRAKNSCLELQGTEAQRYSTVLDRLSIGVAELDWGKSAFSYSPVMPEILAGCYDGRSLWRILMSDLVADSDSVRKAEELVQALASDRTRTDAGISLMLKTAKGEKHMFEVSIYKLLNEYSLTDRIIITFRDTEA